MKHLSRALPRSLAAVACALALLPGAVFAAPDQSIGMTARALVDGRFESGGWVELAIALTNNAEPMSGYVTATGIDGRVQRAVELPAGARKEVSLYLRPDAFIRQVDVSLVTRDGTERAHAAAQVAALDASRADTLVIGDGAGNLRTQLFDDDSPVPISLDPVDLPNRPEPLEGIEAIVWAADSTALSETRRRAVERWVAQGGELVVVGGPDWQARTEAFSQLLPVEQLAARDAVDASALGRWVGSDPPADSRQLTAALGTLRDGAVGLDGSDQPLISVGGSGAGRVIYVAIDMATPAFRTWTGAATFWSRLLPDDRQSLLPGGQVDSIDNGVDGQMNQALGLLPSLQVPPAELLLVVIVGYILLIGPVNYMVLRRLDRRELAWVTAPVLVLVFSLGSYGIGSAMKGSDIIVNRISVARTVSDGTAASVATYAGVVSPGRETYDLIVEADALISSLSTSAFGGDPSNRPTTYVVEQGDPAHLRGLAIGVFGLQAIRAEAVLPYQPALHVEWQRTARGLSGKVTNTSDEQLTDVAVVDHGQARRIGSLDPGGSQEFTLSGSFNGQPPSDQIYGFTNFGGERPTDRELQIFARRYVVDALVGSSPAFQGRLGNSQAQPIVIGWREGGPMLKVTVDEREAKTYDQAIEIVTGRPTLPNGQLSLEPSQLATTVLSTAGDADRTADGGVVLGNGEAHFGISLPIEATNLLPTKISIRVANDPSLVLQDTGSQQKVFPTDYRIAILDRASDEWVDLGDLSQSTEFEVPNPATVLGDGNLMEVRVSGSDVDPALGSVLVYASAVVEGSL
jgi:hypothetical protein